MALSVNGELIDDEALRAETRVLIRKLTAEMPGRDAVELRMRASEWARENLIQRTLLRQAAEADDSLADAVEVEEELRLLGESKPGQSGCVAREMQPDERPQIERRVRMRRLIERVARRAERPSRKEISSYYRENRDLFFMPEMVGASHIVKNIDEQGDSAKAKAEIEAAEAELRRGRSFEEVADEFSDCPGNGGQLGMFPRGQMVEEFDEVAFALPAGEVSSIFRTAFGWHLVKIHEKKAAGFLPLADVFDELEKRLLDKRMDHAVTEFLGRLKEHSDIRSVRRAEVERP